MEESNGNSSQGKLNFDQAAQDELAAKLTKNKSTPDMQRMSFFVLMASGMMFREMYFRDDIDRFKNSPAPRPEAIRNRGTAKLSVKGARKIHDENNAQFERNLIKFNKAVYQEIETTTSTMSSKAKKDFEDIAGFVTMCMEELMYAHDKQEVLGLLRMYNAGELDILFEATRKQKQESLTPDPNAENHTEPVQADL